jgi:hypothetical protein
MSKKELSFVNSKGDKIYYLPINEEQLNTIKNAIKKDFKKRNEPLDPPTREFEVMGGGKQKEILDDTNVITDEEKEILALHQDAVNRLEKEQNTAMVKFLCLKAIDFSMIPDNKLTEWAEEYEYISGVALPANGSERKYQYAMTELLHTSDDIAKLNYESIIAGMDLSKEDAEKFRAFFRGNMDRARKQQLNFIISAFDEAERGALDLQSEVFGDRDSERIPEMAYGIQEAT